MSDRQNSPSSSDRICRLLNYFKCTRTRHRPSRSSLNLNFSLLETRRLLATFHWQGDISTAWDVSGNWLEDAVPTDGSTVVFSNSTSGFSGNYSTNNNIDGLSLETIEFAGGNFGLHGNTVLLDGNGGEVIRNTAFNSSPSITMDFLLQSDGTAAGPLIFANSCSVDTNGHFFNVEINQDSGIAYSTTIYGKITGTGGLRKSGTGQLLMHSENDYQGTTFVDTGSATLVSNGTFGNVVGSTVVGPDGWAIDYTTSNQESFTSLGTGWRGYSIVGGNSTFLGPITLQGDTTLLVGLNNATTDFRGNIGEDGVSRNLDIHATSFRTIILSGNNTFTGDTTLLFPGTLKVDGSLSPASNVWIPAGGTLGGDGVIGGNVNLVNGAILDPGNGAGTLQTGSLLLDAGSILKIEIDSSGNDQVSVTGLANLDSDQFGGALLDVAIDSGFSPAPGSTVVIIDNDGVDPVENRFSGLPNSGDIFASGGHSLRIDYNGGDGNDVVLTFVDLLSPTPVISSVQTEPTDSNPINFGVDFGETVTDFVAADVVAGNGTVSNFNSIDGQSYTFDVTPMANGIVTIDIAAGVALDTAGNLNNAATTFSITYQGNEAPVAQDVALVAVEDGPIVIVAFNADDSDPDDTPATLTYDVVGVPSEGTVINNNDGSFSFDPGLDFQDLSLGETRDVTFEYYATDSHLDVSNTATVTITVTGVNDDPIANAGPNQTLSEGTVVTLDGLISSDVDGDSLTFEWIQTSGPTPVTLSDPNAAQPTFTAPLVSSQNQKFIFEMTVTDVPSGASSVDTVTITVQADNITDSDGDGIINRLDTMPNMFSNDFDDRPVGGTTFGTITNRGTPTARTFTIADKLPNGGVDVDVLTGSDAFQLVLCPGGATELTVDVAANEKLRGLLTCGSALVEVVEGNAVLTSPVDGNDVTVTIETGDIVFFDQLQPGEIVVVQNGTGQSAQIETFVGGQTFTAQLDQGETITYAISATGPVTATATGGEVELVIDGSPVVLTAGKSLTLVQIDIKPGSTQNSINLGSNGVVQVAILSNSSFDALTVDPSTVTLADAGVKFRGNGSPQSTQQDVNNDGLSDLVVHIEIDALQLTQGDELATLKGETITGKAIQGTDTIRIVANLFGETTGALGNDLTTDALRQLSFDFRTDIEIVIADLPPGVLGIAELLPFASGKLGRITVDVNANGAGWFVESTLNSDSFDRYDLLTVLNHEMGHLLGRGHNDEGLMAPILPLGVRRFDTLAEYELLYQPQQSVDQIRLSANHEKRKSHDLIEDPDNDELSLRALETNEDDWFSLGNSSQHLIDSAMESFRSIFESDDETRIDSLVNLVVAEIEKPLT